MGETPAFLTVERSFTGKRWRARLEDDRVALGLAQQLQLPEIVARVLAGRGVGPDAAAGFLEPRLREQLPDPSHLRDMDAGAERVADAVAAGQTIALFGDYDVDGATSAALLFRFLDAVGSRPLIYVPDRLREGYGPNVPALLALQQRGAGLVITVDCGATAHEPLARARDAGLDVIVVDHHVAEARLPPAYAVINPNRLDETSPHRSLAAVGVAFLLAVAVNRVLRRRGHYATRPEPDLLQLIDLVALGTVCDVVPLTGLNRAFVAQGLKIASRRHNIGLAALADVARLSGPCTAYHLGFLLGPRVNAGGRVGQADLGSRLLCTADAVEARALAERLDALNRERQAIEADVLAAAEAQAIEQRDAAIIVVAGDGWHAGVIGIVAGRLRERFERPTCVVAFDGDIGRGSGRTANGLDLGAAVLAARQGGLLINGGGHRNAAGFTTARDRLPALRAFLGERAIAAGQVRGATLGLDGALALGAATPDLVRLVERCGPFGAGNAEPRFMLTDARVVKADIVGERHVRCVLTGPRGGRVPGIAFRTVGTALGNALLDRSGAGIRIAGRFRLDTWQGEERVQFQIDDAAPA